MNPNLTPLLLDDVQYCWHPFTQMKTASTPLAVVRGEGEFLWDEQGRRYFDGVSSWWVNLHGHSHPAIAKAITDQARTLEHAMFAGITHPPAVALAKALIERSPPPMAKVFFSDNGSTAIEVALKMVFQYWQNQGQPQRRRIIALEGGYHGDTFGAMAAGRSSGFYDPFKPWLFEVDFLPAATIDTLGTSAAIEEASLKALDRLLNPIEGQALPAALILEPLVQGASGMRMMRAEHVAALCKRAQQAGVLVIFDEVFTGFGRTGTLFAADAIAAHGGQADLICLSKGLTGGFMPMAVTLTSQAVYDAFLSDNVHHALLHGHSYTANPLGCAAALASLALLNEPATQARMAAIASTHERWLATLCSHPAVENPRRCGTIAAFELKSRQNNYGSSVSQWIRETGLQLGLLLRPLGNTVYWVPPYCTSVDTLDWAYTALLTLIDRWTQHNAPDTGSELF